MTIALVLSGGGARGAYEVGLVAGIVEVLGLGPNDPPPFTLFTGTSVGAINAAYLAAHADRGDMEIGGLIDSWTSLSLETHVKLDVLRLMGVRDIGWLRKLRRDKSSLGRSFLDPTPLHEVVDRGVPWARLHENIRSGKVQGLVVTALHIASGRTHMFAELAPGRVFQPSPDPRRIGVSEPITRDHVFASAAIPLVFPAHRLDNAYYCDGGLRFNTPLSPALRSGADKLVVIRLLRGTPGDLPSREELYPNPFFLTGKLLAALLLDPIDYDLKILERTNVLMETLEATLAPHELERFHDVLEKQRGVSYRRVEALAFRPSADLGVLAGDFLAEQDRTRASPLTEFVVRRAAMLSETHEADLVSFLLYDGGFAERLVEVGRRDARSRGEDIRRFFATAF